jgi:hypothetical protein
MAAIYNADEVAALDVFREFKVQVGEYLPEQSWVGRLMPQHGARAAVGLIERLLFLGAIETRPYRHEAYFLTPLGASFLYEKGLSTGGHGVTTLSKDREQQARRDEHRYRFLRHVFDVTGGKTSAYVNMWEIGQELGLTRGETDGAAEYLKGKGLIEHVTIGGGISLTAYGVEEVEHSIKRPQQDTEHFPAVAIHNYGTVIQQHGSGNSANVGNTTSSTIHASNVAGVAAGPGASATGTVGASDGQVSRADFVAFVGTAQKALVDAQDQLGDATYEELSKIVHRVRKLEFETASAAQLQARIKSTVDDAEIERVAAQLKGTPGVSGLEVFKLLFASPITVELAKKLMGG